jgi:chorismate dehydratase
MSELIRISAVSYLNTFPFVFGIKTSGELENIDLELDVPSECSRKLLAGEVDVALVPVGAIPRFENPVILPDYCIGAENDVKTVILASHVPLSQITEIALDYDSETSVRLARILARDHWKISPAWKPLAKGESEHPEGIVSLVAIGDKTFGLINKYEYIYDLAGEWIRFTSLPFVFAVWLSNYPLHPGFTQRFNRALEYGITHIQEIPEFFKGSIPRGIDSLRYYRENISFRLDERKRQGMERFLELMKNKE